MATAGGAIGRGVVWVVWEGASCSGKGERGNGSRGWSAHAPMDLFGSEMEHLLVLGVWCSGKRGSGTRVTMP